MKYLTQLHHHNDKPNIHIVLFLWYNKKLFLCQKQKQNFQIGY